jgi:tetratricopeptide (TPR) repeat protein
MSEALVDKLLLLQKNALEEKAEETYRKATLLIQETYVFLQQYDNAIANLQSCLQSNLIQDLNGILAITDKLISLLVKTEDFAALEAALIYRERFIADTPKQILMQSFYRAVCYEGLKRYAEAIEVLHRIGDNISNNNLVSKYLKLSMLEIRLKHYPEAKAAYEHALIFDKSKKNEMFYLVESDLSFFEGDFISAMKKFQEFFLKSKEKNRYIDRYISINIAMGNYEEAWKFYQEYAPKIDLMLSKNYRYQFYQAGCQLAESMKKFDEAAEIKEKMLGVHQDTLVILDIFDGMRSFLSACEKKVVFTKSRDIILDTFRNLSAVIELDGLYFIQPSYGEALIYRYQKGLLMESKVGIKSLDSTVTGRIIASSSDYLLFTAEEIKEFATALTDPIFLPAEICSVQAFRILIDATKSGFLVALMGKNTHFDFANKLLFLTKSILDTKLSYFLRLNGIRQESKAFERLFTTEDRGLAKIVDGIVFLMNSKSREILECEQDMIPYESLQSLFQTENTVFLDRLIAKTVWTLPVMTFRARPKQVEIRVLVDELTTYLAFKDVTDEVGKNAELRTQAGKSARYDLWNMHRFLADYANLKTQTSLFLIQPFNQSLLQRNYPHSQMETMTRLWHSSFQKAGKNHLLGCYLEENGSLLAILTTVDKRVIDRIFREFREQSQTAFHTLLPSYDYPDLRGGVMSMIKNKTLEENLDHLYQTWSFTTKEEPLAYYDKQMMMLEAQKDAVRFQLNTLLESGVFLLDYRQVGNLETRKVEMYRAWLAEDLLPFGPEMVKPVAMASRSIMGLEMMIFKQMIKDIARFYDQTDIDVAFASTFGDETLQEPASVNEILQICRRHKIPTQKVGIIYQPSAAEIDLLSVNSLSFLKEKGFRIGMENILPRIRLSDKECFANMDVLFVSVEDFLSAPKSIITTLLGHEGLKMIVTGIHEDEKARLVVSLHGSRVEGKVLGPNQKMDDLIQKMIKKG